jgi:hypothetical protein
MPESKPSIKDLDGLAGTLAFAVAGAGVFYSVSFVGTLVTASRATDGIAAFFLLLTGLATTGVVVALYGRLKGVAPGLALWGMVLALSGALGAVVHGGYDLANAVNPPERPLDLPSAVDPRGLLTFGLSAIAVAIFARLMASHPGFPHRLVALGFLLAALLAALYLARLFILDPRNPVLLAVAGLTGLIVNPAWYALLGVVLRGMHSTSDVQS